MRATTEKTQKQTEYGIYLDPDICRDENLTPATRIIIGQIRQYAKGRQGCCIASNGKLSRDCGISVNTVTNAIAALSECGLIKVTKDVAGRRSITAKSPYADSPQILGAVDAPIPNPVGPHPKELDEPPKNLTEAHKDCLPSSQNLGVHLNSEVNSELDVNIRMKKKTMPSSFSILTEVPTPDTGKDSPLARMALEWATQASSMMYRRGWEKRQKDGTTSAVMLPVPTSSASSSKDLLQLYTLASVQWPGCDPVLGVRQVLRACAWTDDRRDRLQQYAHIATSDSLNVRGVLRIGGREDPLEFANNCIPSVPEPPDPVEPGSHEEAIMIRSYAYSTKANWCDSFWHPCWLEVAGRCRAIGIQPELYMSYAVYTHEKQGATSPLPWVAASLSMADYETFLTQYKLDRFRAWGGGRCRPPADPNFVPGDYESCVGCKLAQAVAEGKTEFSSGTCLRCAAKDLRIFPKLLDFIVCWTGTAEELALKLEGLAENTDSDIPPIRGASCGIEEMGGTPPSYKRCAHGLKPGTTNPADIGKSTGNGK